MKLTKPRARRIPRSHPVGRYSVDDVQRLLDSGKAIDGTAGGLLIGRTHAEGGIPVLLEQDGFYELDTDVEGYEFLISREATQVHSSHLEELNNVADRRANIVWENVPEHVATIDCSTDASDILSLEAARFLVLRSPGTYFFINKHSTWKYLQHLDQLNKSVASGAQPPASM